ncbi:unnamed protein product [Rotaria magnacalcarata]|uniref:poly(ADP-ribose) glycohydrolase n=2 Tax=Rotaria magnacalcarata TaxID=392030 RepID=A0A816XDH6_9BILA|nr:unnamed protein product [Rotaria magnacalcarata]CAF1655075.1 unnamed protein product [Rotaria magnacalcarata]CAF2145591.1 unnamed protein product [Rotaria magnacalcarata]CAF4130735.1 unnamed protein product [Rotaria magnacalcarata]CAF4141584.1 unnamed protein product [Rotaria magnacalcarata]
MSDRDSSARQRRRMKLDQQVASPRGGAVVQRNFANAYVMPEKVSKGTPLEDIINKYDQPPNNEDMERVDKNSHALMILPFKFDLSLPNVEPGPINYEMGYFDRWENNYVRMPCSLYYTLKNNQPVWFTIREELGQLKKRCDAKLATFKDLQATIMRCAGNNYDTYCLELLITRIYVPEERIHFMSTVLSNICDLALNVNTFCSRSPPLLLAGKNHSVTMSQRQAASLLACAFFSLFPYRSQHEQTREYKNFQDPNFLQLYQYGPTQKIEKLRCILHYFQRITQRMPNGVITFQRFSLPESEHPKWPKSKAPLSPVHLTMNQKIEDIDCVLQVDFANRYIGGGVLGAGCVQEEIRFCICPEMLVSLLICEKMEPNECIFLIGCERYASYEGYADSFQFGGNYKDNTPKDNWGRKWCHVVAMDAIRFPDQRSQYNMKYIDRDLLKAYTSFYPQETKKKGNACFGIATGSWGCGVFNGDRQVKAIIQLMAASAAGRPLIYASYLDKKLVNSFFEVHQYLLDQKAEVRDLYRYLERYCGQPGRSESLFEYILRKPISSLKS